MSEPTRREWCWENRPTDRTRIRYTKVFAAGETMRCPRVRQRANGRLEICGHSLGRAPRQVSNAVVALIALPAIPNSEHQVRTCDTCHKDLDVYLVGYQEMRATG